jgi:2-hydroxy-6-oxonona-2,4-dienedioate hydrolase
LPSGGFRFAPKLSSKSAKFYINLNFIPDYFATFAVEAILLMIFKLNKDKQYVYNEMGEGEPMVLLHGLMGGLSNFDQMLPYFSSRGFKVYVPQMPIYDSSIIKTNLKDLSKFIVRFINDVVGQPANLVGNSLGGHIGLITTLHNPEVVRTLTLTGSSGLYEKSFGDSFPRKSDKEYLRKKAQEVFYDPAVATDELVDEVFDVVNDRMKGLKTVMIAKSAIKHNMIKDLPNILRPTCIIWGKQDGVTPPDVADAMKANIPVSDLYWIDKCGHAAMMEHPDLFNEILYGWYQKTLGV